jgi:hypothetical protein
MFPGKTKNQIQNKMAQLRKLFGINANEMKLAAKLREMTITKL